MRAQLTLAIVCACFAVTLFARLPKPHVSKSDGYKVGLVFDVGGLGDKSFNDGAQAGLVDAEARLGVRATTIEPGDGSDRAAALRMLAASGTQLVFGVGFIFTDDILQVAVDHPHTSFACIDMSLRENALPPNVIAIKFREEHGSFLTGVFAATLSQSKKLGFVGGMDIPLIHKFSAGYRSGIRAVCPSCELNVLFAGATPNAFKDPGKGREMALSQYENGADIIYHAAGATGLGVFQAGREKKRFAIGVDSDQAAEAPGVVIGSMVKRIDRAVFDTIEAAMHGRLKPGIQTLGLKEGALELVRDRTATTAEVEEKIAHYTQLIIDGAIEVPDHD